MEVIRSGARKTHARSPRRTAAILGFGGMVTGLMSGLAPSPFPEMKVGALDWVISASYAPLHAGLLFAAMLTAALWRFGDHSPMACLSCFVTTVFAWLAAVNTTISFVGEFGEIKSFGAEASQGAWEALVWTAAGMMSGAIGASLTLYGAAGAAARLHRTQAWVIVILVGAFAGALLYPSAGSQRMVILFVVWQAAVAGVIGYEVRLPLRSPD